MSRTEIRRSFLLLIVWSSAARLFCWTPCPDWPSSLKDLRVRFFFSSAVSNLDGGLLTSAAAAAWLFQGFEMTLAGRICQIPRQTEAGRSLNRGFYLEAGFLKYYINCGLLRWPQRLDGWDFNLLAGKNRRASCVLIHFMCFQVFDLGPFEGSGWHDEPEKQLKLCVWTKRESQSTWK